MLYQFHWGFRKDGRTLDAFKAWAHKELRPILQRLLDTALQQDILVPQAAYGYWKCAAEGNDLIVFAEDGRSEVARVSLPRQNKQAGLGIADFFPDVTQNDHAVIRLPLVTIGPPSPPS